MWKQANQSLIGAWQLFLNRPEAIRHFQTDRNGIGFSFVALAAVGLIVILLRDRHSIFSGVYVSYTIAELVQFQALRLVVPYLVLPLIASLPPKSCGGWTGMPNSSSPTTGRASSG